MTTRDLRCPQCGHTCERTALGFSEPPLDCEFCDSEMVQVPTFPVGVKYVPGCGGFTVCDYPKSNEQLKKDYGFDKEDSTNEDSDYARGKYDRQ